MAYDEALAARVRDLVGVRPGVAERRMFGAVAWMIGGNLAVGVVGDALLVRLDPESRERALLEDGVRPFAPAGRPMKGFVLVGAERLDAEHDLAAWIDGGADVAASMPEKPSDR